MSDTKNFIIALLKLESHLEVQDDLRRNTTCQELIYSIITEALRLNIPEMDKRTHILKEAFVRSEALFIPTQIVDAWRHYYFSPNDQKQLRPPLLDQQGVQQLKILLLEQINTEADLINGKLRSHKFIAIILFYWKEWTSEKTIKEWTNKLIEADFGEDNSGLWQLLRGFDKSYYDNNGLDSLHNYVDITLLKNKIDKISLHILTTKQKSILENINMYYP